MEVKNDLLVLYLHLLAPTSHFWRKQEHLWRQQFVFAAKNILSGAKRKNYWRQQRIFAAGNQLGVATNA